MGQSGQGKKDTRKNRSAAWEEAAGVLWASGRTPTAWRPATPPGLSSGPTLPQGSEPRPDFGFWLQTSNVPSRLSAPLRVVLLRQDLPWPGLGTGMKPGQGERSSARERNAKDLRVLLTLF